MASETQAAEIWIARRLAASSELATALGPTFNTFAVRKSRTNYQSGTARYVPSAGNGHVYIVSVGGRTAATEPEFPGDDDEEVVDGTVTWMEDGTIEAVPKVFSSPAPADAVEPFVTFAFQQPTPVPRVGQGGKDLWVSLQYQVKVISRGADKAIASAAASVVDEALTTTEDEDYGLVVFAGHEYVIMGCYREQPLGYVEVTDGAEYNHIGALYRVLVSANGSF